MAAVGAAETRFFFSLSLSNFDQQLAEWADEEPIEMAGKLPYGSK